MSWQESLAKAMRASSEWVQEEASAEPEPVNHYWFELDCTPSTWAAIVEHIRSQPTANRKHRFHPKKERS